MTPQEMHDLIGHVASYLFTYLAGIATGRVIECIIKHRRTL
jgi:hypothetical protein